MIEVVQNSEPHSVKERCCFCRRPTDYWYEAKDVAVCRSCAPHAEGCDVPTKAVWMRREIIAEASSRPPRPKHPRKKGEDEKTESA